MAKVSKAMWTSNNGISVDFGQVGGMIIKTVNDELQNIALEVQKKAREYVPVDLGYAEKAIKIDNQNQRRRWSVYLDLNEQATHDGRTYPVGDYLVWLHENQSYKLGPKSQAKAAYLGVNVGPKFLERAFADVVTNVRLSEIKDDIDQVVAERTDRRIRKKLEDNSADIASDSQKIAEMGDES